MEKSVLSTKKLTGSQQELLLNAGISLVEQDFISIVPIPFELKEIPENLIFTSKNAVKAILDHPKLSQLKGKKCFVVGAKTSELLRANGFSVARIANYGSELAKEICEFHKTEKFLFLCGKTRHPELPKQLRENNIHFSEIEVYNTLAAPKKIDRIFDGILFFSPSGVKSYCSENDLSGSIAFCIGETTASEAKKYTDNIVIATKQSIENVIVKAVNKLR